MFSDKNEGLALLIATIVFALVGAFQLYRFFAGLTVSVGGMILPVWISLVVGCFALFMAYWLGGFFRRHKKA